MSQPPFPTPEEWLLTVPPYQKYSIDDEYFLENEIKLDKLMDLQYLSLSLDIYCPDCEKQTTISTEYIPASFKSPDGKTINATSKEILRTEIGSKYLASNRIFSIDARCSRNRDHFMTFTFMVKDGYIFKIGQYPSLADIQLGDLQKYRRLIKGETGRELTKAIGLHAHGASIGAFVYLRRVFEKLIREAEKRAITDSVLSEVEFLQLRMGEKIKALSGYLPQILVENAALYSILSRGVHELSEEECARYFDTVRLGIILILE